MAIKKLLIIFVLLLVPSWGFADVIPSSRIATWQGNVGVPGGIPARDTQCGATLATNSTTAQVNTAITNCSAGQYVQLAAGTFTNLSGAIIISKSNVTLRGAVDANGDPATTLVFSSAGWGGYYVGALRMGGSNGMGIASWDITTNWTAGYSQGTTVITLASVSGLSAGMILVLDQLNDSNNVFSDPTADVNSVGQEGLCTYCDFVNGTRTQAQWTMIESIAGNDVTISPGLLMPNWSGSLSPQAHAWTSGTTEFSGVENVIIDAASGVATDCIISMAQCYGCWFYNVWTRNAPPRAHMFLQNCLKCQVSHSDWRYMKTYASVSYGLALFRSSNCLIEDNVIHQTAGGILVNTGASGNVTAYNYEYYNRYDSPTGWQVGSISIHASHGCMNLFEGNQLPAIASDDIHGSSSRSTVFRNRLYGTDYLITNNAFAVYLQAWQRYYNIVGNILGTAGVNTYYEKSDIHSGPDTGGIYYLSCCGSGGNDSVTRTTLLRHRNYDSANAAVRNCSQEAEGCQGGDGSTTLPNSLYLTTKPTWMCNETTWPPVNPATPTVSDIPAKRRYDSAVCTLGGTPTPNSPTGARLDN